MKIKHFISAALALLLVCSLPVTALAAEYDLAEGSVTVTATESGQTVTHGSNAAVPDDAPVIIQSNSETPTANTVTINADAGATANVTLDGVNIDTRGTLNAAVEIQGEGDVVIELDGSNTVQSDWDRAGVEKNTRDPWGTNPGSGNGNLTITDENETHGSLKATGGGTGAGIGGGQDRSGSNITITGNAEVTAQGGHGAAGIGGSDDNDGRNITISGNAEVIAIGGGGGAGIGGGSACGDGSYITIEGNAKVTAKGGDYAAGIGGGESRNGSNITITGSAEVTAKGGTSGAGIGGGRQDTGIDITVSGDAQVKAQGGCDRVYPSVHFGSGAAIGDGAQYHNHSAIPGREVDPNTDALTTNGKIEYYSPGANMENDNPIKTVTGTVPPQNEEKPPVDEEKPPVDEEKPDRPSQSAEAVYSEPLYRVIDQDGKDIPYKAEQSRGVLTITVDADFASLTGSLGGINALKEQGIDTIVFVTKGASSTFALSDLLAQGSTGDSYTLNHNGDTVSFTLGEAKTDINEILAQP